MSEVHYINNAQISERIENGYKFSLPKFGESTTDPTYYEPTATRIANMKKSATSMQGLYDFAGSVKGNSPKEIVENSLKQLSEGVVDVRYSKHGMTKEEISQITMEKSLQADSMINNKIQEKKDKKSKLEEEVALATAINVSTEKALSKGAESADSAE